MQSGDAKVLPLTQSGGSCLALHLLNDEDTCVQEALSAIGETVRFPRTQPSTRLTHALIPARLSKFRDDLLHGSLLVLLSDESLHVRGSARV